MKAGWQTTEFWVLIVFAILNMLAVLSGFIKDPTLAAIALAAVSSAYAIARGVAKLHSVDIPKDLQEQKK